MAETLKEQGEVSSGMDCVSASEARAASGKMPDETQKRGIIRRALEKLPCAYAPYSHFHVAAALLCADGSVYTGCNVENASYSATNCAERSAFFRAVNDGKREFTAIAICGGPEGRVTDYCAPCGVCRQVMREFCRPGDFLILLAKSETDYREYTLEELLPVSFGPEFLQSKPGIAKAVEAGGQRK